MLEVEVEYDFSNVENSIYYDISTLLDCKMDDNIAILQQRIAKYLHTEEQKKKYDIEIGSSCVAIRRVQVLGYSQLSFTIDILNSERYKFNKELLNEDGKELTFNSERKDDDDKYDVGKFMYNSLVKLISEYLYVAFTIQVEKLLNERKKAAEKEKNGSSEKKVEGGSSSEKEEGSEKEVEEGSCNEEEGSGEEEEEEVNDFDELVGFTIDSITTVVEKLDESSSCSESKLAKKVDLSEFYKKIAENNFQLPLITEK